MIYSLLIAICIALIIALTHKRKSENAAILQEQQRLSELKLQEQQTKNTIEQLKLKEQEYNAFFKSEERRKQSFLEQSKQNCDLELEAYRVSKKSEIDQYITEMRVKQENECKERYQKFDEKVKLEYNKQWQELEENLAKQTLVLQHQEQLIAEYKAKQDAINEAILLREELKNNTDTHRIILDDGAIQDIHYLLSIEDNMHNKDLLHKLIWSEYLQKPFNEMINRSFGSQIPKNVIYCIENIETEQKYIGRTKADVSKRWVDHIKTSLNIGDQSKKYIHKMLYKNWDKFVFTVLETVPNEESLNEREKFYINFYQSNTYGYNLNCGG